ncbi:MAG: trypsin-like peptidase domain-containing protein [Polyangiaceae bacterium]|nr:trypsin-like peptidase domain-containing protein [Polyangiaceae bacterium]
MKSVVKVLRSPSASADSVAFEPPVVRVQARFGNTWAAWGSGFFIGQWPSSIITARHVVALPQGIAPSDVKAEAFICGVWTKLEVVAIAFPEGGNAAPDVAIVRIQGTCTTGLQAATMDGPCRVEIWGYPLGVGRTTSGLPAVVGTRAFPGAGQLRIERPGRAGMSGGPVVAVSDAGSPLAAVGIYLGTSPNGAKARVLIDDFLFAAKDAAMNAIA